MNWVAFWTAVSERVVANIATVLMGLAVILLIWYVISKEE